MALCTSFTPCQDTVSMPSVAVVIIMPTHYIRMCVTTDTQNFMHDVKKRTVSLSVNDPSTV